MRSEIRLEACYSNGNLAGALALAAEFVKKIGEKHVLHIVAHEDPGLPGAWWVDVVYYHEER